MLLFPTARPLFAVALLLLLGAALEPRSGDLANARYFSDPRCEEAPLYETAEPLPRLIYARTIASRLIARWPTSRDASHAELPEWCVEWAVHLRVPADAGASLSKRSTLYPTLSTPTDVPQLAPLLAKAARNPPPPGALRLVAVGDGMRRVVAEPISGETPGSDDSAESVELLPGEYRVTVAVGKGELPLAVPLAILRGDRTIVPVPAAWITRAYPWSDGSRARPLLALAGAALIVLSITLPRVRKRRVGERASLCAALLGLMLLGGALRTMDLDSVPYFSETMDEIDLGWAAWGLAHHSPPAGWFFVDGPYRGYMAEFFGEPLYVVIPNLHRPPLLPWLLARTGAVDNPGGMYGVRLPDLRTVPVALAVLSIPLVFALTRAVASETAAWCSAIIYATTPLLVISNRLTKEDNVLAFFGLASVTLIAWRHRLQWRFLTPALAGALAGCSVVSKVPGLAFVISGGIVFLADRHIPHVIAYCVGAMLVMAALPLYGLMWDWELFLRVQHYLSTLQITATSISEILYSPRITNEAFGIGQYNWLLFAAVLLRGRAARTIGVPLALYILFLTMSVNANRVYGWYHAPLYPLLAAAAGAAMQSIARGQNPFAVAVFFGMYAVPGIAAVLSWETLINSRLLTRCIVGAVIGGILAPILIARPYRRQVTAVLAAALFICGVISNMVFVSDLPTFYPRYVMR